MPRQLKSESLLHRLDALGRHHAHLEARLHDALASPIPDAERVVWLKREKLRVKDEMARLARMNRPGWPDDKAPIRAE